MKKYFQCDAKLLQQQNKITEALNNKTIKQLNNKPIQPFDSKQFNH